MYKQFYRTSIFLVFVFFLSPVFAAEKEKVFTVGVVPQFDARKIHATWRPILDKLEQKTGYKFQLRGSSSIPTFEREFSEGKFDFAYMNPYHLIVANKFAGYIPMLRDTGRKLYGVLVVRKDSPISNPRELDGKTLAFPSPNALGASLMIRKDLEDDFKIKISPRYVKTHDSVYLNVLLGQAAAGGGVQKTLNRQRKDYKDAMRVLYKTKEVNPHPFAALPGVPLSVREQVTAAMLEMGQTPEGKEMLARIPMKKIGKASMEDYQPLREMDLDRFYYSP